MKTIQIAIDGPAVKEQVAKIIAMIFLDTPT